MVYKFENRTEAGEKLAESLIEYKGKKDVLILALPRGGVPVAYEVAKVLSLPLDVLLVRKLGMPGNEELAIGAIAWDHLYFINQNIVNQFEIPNIAIKEVIIKEQTELLRRNTLYRGHTPPPIIEGKIVIIVDDGLATGATMHAAISVLHQAKAKYIVVAVPVGPYSTCRELEAEADEVVCLYTPEPFYGVGQWYNNFSQTSDKEVQHILNTSYQTYNDKKVQYS